MPPRRSRESWRTRRRRRRTENFWNKPALVRY
jgi:hypothetical protein